MSEKPKPTDTPAKIGDTQETTSNGETENNRSKQYNNLVASLQKLEEKKFQTMFCPICNEILTIRKDRTTCKNKCENPNQLDPLYREYNPKKANFAEFCIYDEYGRARFKPMKCAQYIKTSYLFKTCKETKILYYYDPEEHKWSINGEVYLQEILGEQLGIEYRQSYYNNVLDALKAITYEDIEFGEKIAVKNGLLDVKTMELTPFTPNEMPFFSIPVIYQPEAKSVVWENFCNQIVAPEDQNLLQEWSGFLLSPGYPKHKFMFMYGVGRNGKGVWSRTMRGILGKDNCVSMRLEEFNGDRRFAIARLYGKKYCECSEPLTNKTLQTPILKALTGADNQDAEVKGIQKTLGFVNEAKVTVFGNRYPRVNDNTEGFYDRFEILEFPHHFSESEQVADLENTWLENDEEKSGILNWMLTGLQRLLQNNYKFTISKTQQEKLLELKRLSDPTGAFLEECCEIKSNIYITRKDLRDAYTEYCEEIGAIGDKEGAFTQRIKSIPKVKMGSKRIEGKAERCWLGVGLKEMPQIIEDSAAKQTTLGTDAADAADAAFRTPVIIAATSKNREGIKRASPASRASLDEIATANTIEKQETIEKEEPKDGVNASSGSLHEAKDNIILVLKYKLIAPNAPTPCEGYNCGHEAKYCLDGNNYCQKHFDESKKSCNENGFAVVEDTSDLDLGEENFA